MKKEIENRKELQLKLVPLESSNILFESRSTIALCTCALIEIIFSTTRATATNGEKKKQLWLLMDGRDQQP